MKNVTKNITKPVRLILTLLLTSSVIVAVSKLFYLTVWLKVVSDQAVQLENILTTGGMFIVGLIIGIKQITRIDIWILKMLEVSKYFLIIPIWLGMWDLALIVSGIYIGLTSPVWITFDARVRATNITSEHDRIVFANYSSIATVIGGIGGYGLGTWYFKYLQMWQMFLILNILSDVCFWIQAYLINKGKLNY